MKVPERTIPHGVLRLDGDKIIDFSDQFIVNHDEGVDHLMYEGDIMLTK